MIGLAEDLSARVLVVRTFSPVKAAIGTACPFGERYFGASAIPGPRPGPRSGLWLRPLALGGVPGGGRARRVVHSGHGVGVLYAHRTHNLARRTAVRPGRRSCCAPRGGG